MSIASSGNSVKCLYFVRYSFVSKGTKSDVHVTFIRVDNRWTIPVTYLPRLFVIPPSPGHWRAPGLEQQAEAAIVLFRGLKGKQAF